MTSKFVSLPVFPAAKRSNHSDLLPYPVNHNDPKVLLLSMPWASLTEPSLGLAILKAKLLEDGIACTVRHQNIFFLEYLKSVSYDVIGARWGFNDFLFTKGIQADEVAPEQLEALANLVHNNYRLVDLQGNAFIDPQPFIDYALKIRNEVVPQFLEDAMKVVDTSNASMVGFTCMYDQTFASLALAKLIKERYPDKLIVFGGYALEKPVGFQIFNSFPFVDALAFGECEEKITLLAEASIRRENLAHIPNIIFRDGEGRTCQSNIGTKPINLDESPTPDFDDYFNDLDELKSNHQVEVEAQTLPVESSRGCWWGQLAHCTFCGIDDETMKYRSKSPERTKSMLSTLHGRYGPRVFRFADYILPRQYYKTLFPILADQPEKYFLHWEMKSNVKARDLELMSRAGIIAAQPGIESFSTSVLKKMCKGVSGIQNVFTIKMLMEYNINVNYNILFGFPTDEPHEYREQIKHIPSLYHLAPPYSYIPVQTTRFAPMQTDPKRFGITQSLHCEHAYEIILSSAYRRKIGFDLDNYCYIFETPYEFDPVCAELYNLLVYQISHWIQLYTQREPRLSYRVEGSTVEYFDSRYQEEPRILRFGCEHGWVQAGISGRIVTREQLVRELKERLDRARIFEVLEELAAERLIYQEGDGVTGLAFPEVCYQKWEELRSKPLLESLSSDKQNPVCTN